MLWQPAAAPAETIDGAGPFIVTKHKGKASWEEAGGRRDREQCGWGAVVHPEPPGIALPALLPALALSDPGHQQWGLVPNIGTS